MEVCKCIVALRHGVALNSCQDTSPFMRLVEEKQRWEAPDHLQGILPQNWGWTEPNRTVTCKVLIAMSNDQRTSSPLLRCI
ncbi:uncharacterized protein TNCV_1018491 [Trichonephila clavipes]|nr:uncharacterized protein TNCV_1018491 [Trichonephila clavipes]